MSSLHAILREKLDMETYMRIIWHTFISSIDKANDKSSVLIDNNQVPMKFTMIEGLVDLDLLGSTPPPPWMSAHLV